MQLDDLRRWVTWNLACGALVDVELPVVGDDGGCPVVVALEEESLSTLLGRLRAVGGFANLFVGSDIRVRMLTVIDANCAILEPDDDMTPSAERPGATATVGMFVDYVERRPNGVVLSIVSGDAKRPALARDARTVDFAGITP
jgi:hypothetical protein